MLAKILFRHHSISSSNRYNVFQLSTVLQDLHLLVEPILVQNQITCTHSLASKSEGWSNKAIINLNSLAERRKHFSENQFFVPNRIIWVLFYGGFTLQTNKMFTRQIIITIIPSLIKAIRAWKKCNPPWCYAAQVFMWFSSRFQYFELTDNPANETCTYGLTRSFASPVKALLTFAIIDEFIRGNPSAR